MKQTIKELVINGETYIRKEDASSLSTAVNSDGLQCVIIRTYSAGVHFGFLKSRKDKEVVLINSRRVYYWDGAASLSQMAVDGVSEPENCKFSVVVPEITLTEAIEIIPITTQAQSNLFSVPVWKR